MIDHALVQFYRLWHGKLHLKGAGALLSRMAERRPALQNYQLRLPEGATIGVDFRDVSAMYWLNHLLGDHFEEKGLLTAISPFLNGTNVVWDIGANSGLLSYHLARQGKLRELHLFEPNPRMVNLATQALARFPYARIHPFGLSDRDAILTLTIPRGHTTMGTLEAKSTERSGAECEVACRKGDDLVTSGTLLPPDLIKIDTEGHELAVLAGLARTIELYRPVIFFEHISLDRKHVMDLMPVGYNLFTVCDRTGALVDSTADTGGHNSVLIPSS